MVSKALEVALLAVVLAACEEPAHVERVSSDIVNGTVTWLRPEVAGVMYVPPQPQPREDCSGTLIGSRFVLTAGHCVHFDEINPSRYNVAFLPPAPQAPRYYKAVHIFNLGPRSTPADPFPNDHFLGDKLWLDHHQSISPGGDGNDDLAVLMLDGDPPFTPARVNTTPAANGYFVTAFGYGESDSAGHDDDQKRWRSWNYNRIAGGRQQPAGGPVLGSGDSGGPAFFGGPQDNGALWGVASGAGSDWDRWGDAAYWRPAIMYALDTGRNTRWFDARTEDLAEAGWPMQQVDVTPWAQANRSGAGYCGRMTYVVGLLNGWQGTTAYGTVCLGKARLFDINQTQRNSSPWTFTDVDTVSWDRAARVADTLCRQFGYIGGQFNGHHDNTGLMGLACYTADAQWFDVPRSYGASIGWPIDDIGSVGWARAARVADRWCTDPARGFVGGRFNGWQSSTNFGVVCYR